MLRGWPLLLMGCGAALPNWPANAELQVTETAPHYIALMWPEAENAVSYVLSVDGDQAERVDADRIEARVDGLDEARRFTVRVHAVNEDGEPGLPIEAVAETTDGTPPEFPNGGQLELVQQSRQLSWPAATDRAAVSYIVFVNGAEFSRTTDTRERVEILDEVRYAVVAEDASGNRSTALELVRRPGESNVVAELGRRRTIFDAPHFRMRVRDTAGRSAPSDQSRLAAATQRCRTGTGIAEFRVQTRADGRVSLVHPVRRTVDPNVQSCLSMAIRTTHLAPGRRTLQVTLTSR